MGEKSSLFMFASTLAGEYSNYKQSQEKPRDFAHIKIYFRPLDWSLLNGPWFYSEQSYSYDPWSPYRQAIHKILKFEDIFIVENYSLKSPLRIAGSGFKPKLLKNIKPDQVLQRWGCSMHFSEIRPGHYIGKVEPGEKCLIEKEGKMTYLVNKVELNQAEFISLDEGIDISTNKKVWGSEHGPLRFKKVKELNNQLVGNWLQIT